MAELTHGGWVKLFFSDSDSRSPYQEAPIDHKSPTFCPRGDAEVRNIKTAITIARLTKSNKSATMGVLNMLKIRLQRVGRKNDPSFRVVVMPKQKDSQSGKVVEILGSYNARSGRPEIKGERVKYWIANGAQISGTVRNILIDQKVIAGRKVNVLPARSAGGPKRKPGPAPKIDEPAPAV